MPFPRGRSSSLLLFISRSRAHLTVKFPVLLSGIFLCLEGDLSEDPRAAVVCDPFLRVLLTSSHLHAYILTSKTAFDYPDHLTAAHPVQLLPPATFL